MLQGRDMCTLGPAPDLSLYLLIHEMGIKGRPGCLSGTTPEASDTEGRKHGRVVEGFPELRPLRWDTLRRRSPLCTAA